MEYLEQGSLADRIEQGPLPVDEPVAMFQDVAVGLLACSRQRGAALRPEPANILLDQDSKPAWPILASRGCRTSRCRPWARCSTWPRAGRPGGHARRPLGRVCLGALLYCMLTGSPPYRDGRYGRGVRAHAGLAQRLARYRRTIEDAPPPIGHRQVRGVDRALADIVDRCLAADPCQAVSERAGGAGGPGGAAGAAGAASPGGAGGGGPALAAGHCHRFAWRGFSAAIRQSDAALVDRALQSNRLTAQYVARAAATSCSAAGICCASWPSRRSSAGRGPGPPEARPRAVVRRAERPEARGNAKRAAPQAVSRTPRPAGAPEVAGCRHRRQGGSARTPPVGCTSIRRA